MIPSLPRCGRRCTLRRALVVVCLLASLASSGVAAEVYFSPDGGVRDQIIKRINHAQVSIDIAMYGFSSGDIAQALAAAQHRGVKVRVIRDRTQSSEKGDENSFLSNAGIALEIRRGKGRGIMHDKFAVFDGKEIFTGSYNWTENAERNNYENALFVEDLSLANAYQAEFNRIWGSSGSSTFSEFQKEPSAKARRTKPLVKTW